MWFWSKRKKNKPEDADVIIHNNCYRKLPTHLQQHFSPAARPCEATHEVVEEDAGVTDNYSLNALATAFVVDEALNYIDGSQLSGSAFPGNDGFQGFGGGSGGGGGAEGTWAGPSESASADHSDGGNTDSPPIFDSTPDFAPAVESSSADSSNSSDSSSGSSDAGGSDSSGSSD